jgi:hypothetical protein
MFFTESETENLFGVKDLDIDDFLSGASNTVAPSDHPMIDSLSKPVLQYATQAANDWLANKKINEAIDQLLTIKLTSEQFSEIRSSLVKAARPGYWTCYSFATQRISYSENPNPEDLGLILDTETFVSQGNFPIIATAVGASGVYIFVDPAFSNPKSYQQSFIDLGNSKRLIVCHNLSFDFKLIKQRYQFDNPVSGICTKALGKALFGVDRTNRWRLHASDPLSKFVQSDLACDLSLAALYSFLFKLPKPSKEVRNIFVDATSFEEFVAQKDTLFSYALDDIFITLQIFQKIYKEFESWLGNPICLQGLIQTADSFMPVADDFETWLAANFKASEQINFEIFKLLLPALTDLHEDWLADCLDLENPMLAKVDFNLSKPKGWRKKVLPTGYPKIAKWFASFLTGKSSLSGKDLTYLLQLRYNNEQILLQKASGWTTISGTKLPHPSGDEKQNLGCVLSAGCSNWARQGILTSDLLTQEDLLKLYDLLASGAIVEAYGARVSEMKFSAA